jgi:hypothetical protein
LGYLALASDLLIAFDTINNTFARHVRRALSLYLHTADTPQNTTERKEEHKDEEEHFAIGDSPRQILLIYTTNRFVVKNAIDEVDTTLRILAYASDATNHPEPKGRFQAACAAHHWYLLHKLYKIPLYLFVPASCL